MGIEIFINPDFLGNSGGYVEMVVEGRISEELRAAVRHGLDYEGPKFVWVVDTNYVEIGPTCADLDKIEAERAEDRNKRRERLLAMKKH